MVGTNEMKSIASSVLVCALAAYWVACGAARGQMAGQTVKGFQLPEYDDQGRLKQRLFGDSATFLRDGIIQLTGLKIEIYEEGDLKARVFSPECAYDPPRKRAVSKEHIRIVAEQAVLTGDGFAWNGETEQFQIFTNAKVVLDSKTESDLFAPRPAEDAAPAKAEAE
jgi:hypothetical protein